MGEKIRDGIQAGLDSKKIAKDFFSNLDNIIEDLRLDLKFAFESDPAAIDDNEIILNTCKGDTKSKAIKSSELIEIIEELSVHSTH